MFQAWGITDLSKFQAAKEAFYPSFFNRTELYPETESVLRELKNKHFKLSVLSDTAYGADKEYLLNGIPPVKQYFEVILASTDIGFRKPHTKGFLQLIKELNVEAADCLFVGDEPKDIIGANRVGMISVLVNRNNEKLDYGQKYTINSLTDILKLV